MKAKIIIVLLVVLLLGSNAYWLHASIDGSVTAMYQDLEMHSLRSAEKQARGMLEESLHGRQRDYVTQLATKHAELESFEKDGCVWIGAYGFRFAESGEFVGMRTLVRLTPDNLCSEQGL